MWEERFATPDYLFGTAPAQFLLDHAHLLTPGATALAVADGEGRNSVFMAGKGMRVTALEYAPSAIEKARALARERGVDVDFREVDVMAHDWPDEFDLVAGIFIQFVGPDDRAALFDGMERSVKPGGLVLLHGYTPRQVDYGTGGPPYPENMYTEAMLARAFAGWEILENHAYERVIEEGTGHSGHSALIDFVARRPADG
ncbi:SAM-dependent methyltransferase [Roseovarius salinarum]|uniref:SAM-dependent methyltransferase n=1 Tax=Roseovarius salinarum TaxID=1981892 RepID=UPI000C335BF7|nr:class I SAM-dependent methyltransferase [Roseovarius salinarum]